MDAQQYLELLQQHTGPLPQEFARRFLALARLHGGKELLEQLGKFRTAGWHWLDFLEEAETQWPVPTEGLKENILQHIIHQLEAVNEPR